MNEVNTSQKSRIALCYFGLTRSLCQVIDNQKSKIFDSLEKGGYDIEIFMHTWKIYNDEQHVWGVKIDSNINYDDYKLLEPTYYKIESQDDFLNSINIYDYFNKEKWDKNGDHRTHGEWPIYLIRNHLCALESQKRCFEMVETCNKKFDFVMIIRPDCVFSQLDINHFEHLKEYSNGILITGRDSFEGYNDKFAIMNYDKASPYCKRIDEIKEWRKHTTRIVSEKFVKFIVDKYYNKQNIDIHVGIIRQPSGSI